MNLLRVLRVALVLLFVSALAAQAQTTLPDAPAPRLLARSQPPPHLVNGVPYQRPTARILFNDYLFDTYWYPGIGRSMIRALYSESRGKPSGWGTDFTGFSERYGSAEAITVINGSVRYGMEMLFHEDLRYLPCKGCSALHKIENALLAEITARHDDTGKRFFTLSPTVADFSGPIIAHVLWYPGASEDALAGVISARTVFATRIGVHIVREFALDRKKKHMAEPIFVIPAPAP